MLSLIIALTALAQAPDYVELTVLQVENARTLAWKPFFRVGTVRDALDVGDIDGARQHLTALENQTRAAKDAAVLAAQTVRGLPEYVAAVEENALANCPEVDEQLVADLETRLAIAEKINAGLQAHLERAIAAWKAEIAERDAEDAAEAAELQSLLTRFQRKAKRTLEENQ